MWKLLGDAWTGWLDYIYAGKYAALLFLALLGYWFYDKKKRQPVLMLYTTVLTVCCIFPLTAVLLMQYQTRFYDYQWIWNYVPLTAVVALGATVFLSAQRERGRGAEGAEPAGGRLAVAAVLTVGLVLVCGLLREPVFDTREQREQQEKAAAVLDELMGLEELAEMEEICLWAPTEIMASARASYPQLCLIYGRDMWDMALRAYTYETYDETRQDLYHWMYYAEQYGTLDGYKPGGIPVEGSVCMKAALAAGVNCILLPGNLQEEALTVLEAAVGQEAELLAGYYFIALHAGA